MTQTGERRKYIAFFLIAVTSSIVFSFAITEIIVRTFFTSWYDLNALQQRLEEGSIKPLIRPVENPEIFFGLRLEMDEMHWSSRVVTNEEGLRISPAPRTIPEDALRIAVIGDSTSFGYRVDYEESYPERLRERLSTEFGVPIGLRNYSVPAYNANQELMTFLDRVVDYAPDLLIVHHDHNDTQQTGFGFPYNYLAPNYGENFLHSAALKVVLRQMRALRTRFEASSSKGDKSDRILGYVYSGPSYDTMIESRRNLARETRLRGLPTLVIIHNGAVTAEDDYRKSEIYLMLHKGLHESLLEMGFYVLDMYPIYSAHLAATGWPDVRRWWVSETDGHPNPEGHQFITDAAFEFIVNEPELSSIFQSPK